MGLFPNQHVLHFFCQPHLGWQQRGLSAKRSRPDSDQQQRRSGTHTGLRDKRLSGRLDAKWPEFHSMWVFLLAANQEFVDKINRNIWIGLSNRTTGGMWEWVDGTPLTERFTHRLFYLYFTHWKQKNASWNSPWFVFFTSRLLFDVCLLVCFSHWMPEEPNNYLGKNEDCVEFAFRDPRKGWNDLPCDGQNFWICEKMIAQWISI